VNQWDGLFSLTDFVKRIVYDGVSDKTSFRVWCKSHEQEMEAFFGYTRRQGMPPITSLVSASFHPTEPLIMLNYTAGAHNTLHEFPEGWTWPLRFCRGIVFDNTGMIVAQAFSKFFNYGEHPETMDLPEHESFEATLKYDGHLGIIFRYKEKFFITTRGDFLSPTAKMAEVMLQRYVTRYNWNTKMGEGFTLLVEVVHPSTKVFVDYGGREELVLLSVRINGSHREWAYSHVARLGNDLGLSVAERWGGDSLSDLKKFMQDFSVANTEGYVVCFPASMLRVKFKFATYINMMVAKKLSYKYLMQRMISGNLDKMIGNLPEEVFERAQEMLEILKSIVRDESLGDKEKKDKLYGLVSLKDSTQYYRKICRDFLVHSGKA